MVREMRSSQQGDILQHCYTVVVRARQSDKLHGTFPTANYETQAQEKASMRCHCTEKGMAASTRNSVFVGLKVLYKVYTRYKLGVMWVRACFYKIDSLKIYRK